MFRSLSISDSGYASGSIVYHYGYNRRESDYESDSGSNFGPYLSDSGYDSNAGLYIVSADIDSHCITCFVLQGAVPCDNSRPGP